MHRPPPAPMPYPPANAAAAGPGGGKLALLALVVLALLEQLSGLAWGVIVLGQTSGWDIEFAASMIGDGVFFPITRVVQIVVFTLLLVVGVAVAFVVLLAPMHRRPAPAFAVVTYVCLSILWWLINNVMGVGMAFGWWDRWAI